jgi:alpha-glucosidase
MKIALLACLRGNIILYQGEELGLTQVDIPFEQLHDPEAIANWPLTLSRDGARTPMPWEVCNCGGFGSTDPWLPLGEENRARAVEAQDGDSQSLLHHTRAMLALRKSHPALHHGAVSRCDVRGMMLVLGRRSSDECVRAFVNLGPKPVTLEPGEADGAVLASVNGGTSSQLPPFAVLVVQA